MCLEESEYTDMSVAQRIDYVVSGMNFVTLSYHV